ncbi:MAG: hypothetical protein AB7I59_11900 [Geminicoccaceae bacterium]
MTIENCRARVTGFSSDRKHPGWWRLPAAGGCILYPAVRGINYDGDLGATGSSVGECLNIRNVMAAARVHAAKHKIAQEAQDACTKIVVLAELDDGDVEEVTAEARIPGRPVTCRDLQRSTAAQRRQREPPMVRSPDHVSYMSLRSAGGPRELGDKRRSGSSRMVSGRAGASACDR